MRWYRQTRERVFSKAHGRASKTIVGPHCTRYGKDSSVAIVIPAGQKINKTFKAKPVFAFYFDAVLAVTAQTHTHTHPRYTSTISQWYWYWVCCARHSVHMRKIRIDVAWIVQCGLLFAIYRYFLLLESGGFVQNEVLMLNFIGTVEVEVVEVAGGWFIYGLSGKWRWRCWEIN